MTKTKYKSIRMKKDESSKEVRKIRDEFKSFKLIDYDEDYIYLVKKGVGDVDCVEGRITRGSLGSYEYKFVVTKKGERGKLFWGRNVIKRIKKYLDVK